METHGTLWVRRFAGDSPPLVALHGFTQTGAAFSRFAAQLAAAVLAIDLPGHGRTTIAPVTMAATVESIAELLDQQAEPVPLVGYSQGGRVALHVALQHPELISHLVVVSGSPGIEDPDQRAARRHADEALAAGVEADGLEAFLDRWLADPRLGTADPERAVADRAMRMENTAGGLAAALRGLGQGSQEYLGPALAAVAVPTVFVAGSLDEDYARSAAAMAATVPDAKLVLLSWTGHNPLRDRPGELAARVSEFLG